LRPQAHSLPLASRAKLWPLPAMTPTISMFRGLSSSQEPK